MAVGVAVGHLFWPYVVYLITKSDYSTALFFGVPTAMSLMASLFLGFRTRRPFKHAALANVCSQLTLAAILVATRWDGVGCLAMALPFTFVVGLLGSWIGWLITNAVIDRREARIGMSASFLLPVAVLALTSGTPSTSHHKHVTVRIISASPERIWPYLFNLKALPEPNEWLFRMGMAYPIATLTEGNQRICELSTGPMPERISAVEKYRRLKFEVTAVPPAMRETNPFGPVHAPHNIEAFRPTAGEFRLEALSDGKTRVVATTWYDHDYGPDAYWSLWTEAVVGSVHNRVLDAIALRTER